MKNPTCPHCRNDNEYWTIEAATFKCLKCGAVLLINSDGSVSMTIQKPNKKG